MLNYLLSLYPTHTLAQIQGVTGQDVFRFPSDDPSPLTIESQVFGQITSFHRSLACHEQDGVLGLGRSLVTTSQHFRSPLGNLQSQLRQSMFSMYLSPQDDHGDHSAPTISASSQLVLGGVNQNHYEGCLKWHNVGQPREPDGEIFSAYWDFQLESVEVRNEQLPNSNLAILDSGSYFVVGPAEAVAKIVEVNKLYCLSLDDDQKHPKRRSCDNATDYDMLATECDAPFEPLNFFAGSESYYLERSDMVYELETLDGTIMCVVRLLGAPGAEGWILGDAFLNRYYTAFDLEGKRLGFAKSSQHNKELCPNDWPLDVRYDGSPLVIPTPAPIPRPETPVAPPPPKDTPPTSPTGIKDQGTVDDVPKPSGFSWMLVVLVSFFFVGCLYIARRRQRQRERREHYSLASRYDDSRHELELT
jgi:hypothetical protein